MLTEHSYDPNSQHVMCFTYYNLYVVTDRISLQMEERRGMESTLLAWIYYQRERNKEKVTTIVALTCTSWFCVGQGGG